MSILENIRFALSALWVNKIRSLLTMLGVIIGVSAVISLMSIGEGVKGEFSNQIENIGSNKVAVLPGKIDTEAGISFGSSLVGISPLKNSDVEALKAIKDVKEVGALALIGGVTKFEDKSIPQALVAGINPEMFSVMEFDLKQGRLFNQEDNNAKERIIVISSGVANELFGGEEEALGKSLTYFGQEMRVVGVANWGLSETDVSSQGFLEGNIAYTVAIPIKTAWEISKAEQIHRIIVAVDSAEEVKAVAQEVEATLLQKHNGSEDFTVMTSEELLDLFDNIFGILTRAIVGIAAISLFVGGIGIMNIMLVSITERTKEIGIRKAIGASSFNILFQFLVESSVLSLLGGFLGVALSYIFTQIITQYAKIPTTMTFGALVLAFGVSVAVGIIFGFMPAFKAARKNPIDALRYE